MCRCVQVCVCLNNEQQMSFVFLFIFIYAFFLSSIWFAVLWYNHFTFLWHRKWNDDDAVFGNNNDDKKICVNIVDTHEQ